MAPTSPPTILKGLGVSEGIGTGHFAIFSRSVQKVPTPSGAPSEQSEILRYRQARDEAEKRLSRAAAQLTRELGPQQGGILGAHALMLKDALFNQEIELLIQKGKTAEAAVEMVSQKLADRLSAGPNSYLNERSSDFQNIADEIIQELSGVSPLSLLSELGEIILGAREIGPADIVELPSNVKGLVLETGSATTHATILARSLRIPMVVGVGELLKSAKEGENVVLDGGSGQVILAAGMELIETHRKHLAQSSSGPAPDSIMQGDPVLTRDGRRVKILANVTLMRELENLDDCHPEGIGLFRTEFLFLHQTSMPSEEEQFERIRRVVEALSPRRVVFRTVDFGADKPAPPHLTGASNQASHDLRGIRWCLEHLDFFRAHLRTILRASRFGSVAIMFPMVPGLEIFRKAKAVLQETIASLPLDERPRENSVPLGVMIEVPSAALMASGLAREADFFSIGTNDLLQYTVGLDRQDPTMIMLNTFLPPSLLRLIHFVVEEAHKKGKPTTICGELAHVPIVIPVLVGLGIDALSMETSWIPRARSIIQSVSFEECSLLAKQALEIETLAEMKNLLEKASPY